MNAYPERPAGASFALGVFTQLPLRILPFYDLVLQILLEA
jgi:hypothetical protein